MTVIQWIVASAIAAFAAIIAYFQWRTAHQRVVLDLFDRRLEVYNQLRSAVASIVTSGKVSPEVEQGIGRAIESARFYFGDEVVTYLDALYKSVVDVGCYSSEIEGTQGPDRAKLIANRRAAFERVESFYKDAPALFKPYMRLDQKMPSLWRFGR